MTVSRLLLVVCICATEASACMCGSAYRGKTPWELAKLEADGTPAIFEGVPVRFRLSWGVLNAKDGEMVPADFPSQRLEGGPHMIVTFRVLKVYKGSPGTEVEITTGLGGGDCGARYRAGITYLVYGWEGDLKVLYASMCSPGGWVGDGRTASELRYLRGERPIATDLIPSPTAWTKETPAREKLRLRDSEDSQRRYQSATGRICGNVFQGPRKTEYRGNISFLSSDGYSPVDHPMTQVQEDGSFCSERLGPGMYYLYFTRFSDTGTASATFYPGVSERAKAAAIEVRAGQDHSNLRFTIPPQKTFSVRGIISVDDKTALGPNDISISLISVDGDYQTWYRRRVDFSGSLPLPKVRFFVFESVPPGHYVAFASASSPGWLTRKVDIDVSTHMKFTSLQLVHRR